MVSREDIAEIDPALVSAALAFLHGVADVAEERVRQNAADLMLPVRDRAEVARASGRPNLDLLRPIAGIQRVVDNAPGEAPLALGVEPQGRGLCLL